MKALILINGAPNHRPFYARVGDELQRRGHTVVYAVDSHFTDVTYPSAPLRGPTHYLSDYFRERRANEQVPPDLADANLWLAMFPDFDRFNSDVVAASRGAWRRAPGYYRALVAAMGWFFVELFDEHAFDCVVYEGVTNAFAYLAFLVAQRRGAQFFGFMAARMPQRIAVVTTVHQVDHRLPAIHEQIRRGTLSVPDKVAAHVREYLARFDDTHPDDTVAFRRVPANPLRKYTRAGSLKRVGRTLAYQLTRPRDHEYAYQVPNMLWVYPEVFAWELGRSIRHRRLRRDFYEQSPPARPYFVYPMHFHPESSTSVCAPFLVDELTTVRNIALSLPVDVMLCVKDHQHTMAARQPMSFYETLARLPNVVLIDPAVDAKRLVKGSLGVVTVTGTMGYEALVLGKPVFVLGHTFYQSHPACRTIRCFEDLFDAIRLAPTMTSSKKDIFDFVAAYYLSTYDGVFDVDVRVRPELVDRVATIIVDRTTRGKDAVEALFA